MLLAKRIRALLQSRGSTAALEALDQLGLALARVMPEPQALFDKSSAREVQLFLLKVIFLNEISQCYKDARSVAFSDDCLELIKTEVQRLFGLNATDAGEGRTPYELIALYNKAQGYLHLKNHEDALTEFEKVTSAFGTLGAGQGTDRYFADSDDAHFGWTTNDQHLWELISRWPAVLQMGDVLSNLQRSKEAQDVLSNFETWPLNPYYRKRAALLTCRARFDMADPSDAEDPHYPFCGQSWEERNLEIQRLSVEVQYCHVSLARRLLALETSLEGGGGNEELLISVNALSEGLFSAATAITNRLELSAGERSETDQGIADWVKGLEFCADAISKLGALTKDKILSADVGPANNLKLAIQAYTRLETPTGWGPVLSLWRAAHDLACDPHFRDYQFETRRSLVHNGWKLFDALVSLEDLAVMQDFLGEVKAQNIELLEGLDEEKLNRSPEYERHWRNQLKLIYDKKPLPVTESPPLITWDPQTELRKVLSQWLIKCKTCGYNGSEKYGCFREHSGSMSPACDAAKEEAQKQAWFSLH
ncbi:MAG: hypothetical protein B7X11_01240, partial [Acidobacteria bacterium 37-65-4]